MGDALEFSGLGTSAVATDALFADSHILGMLAEQLRASQALLSSARFSGRHGHVGAGLMGALRSPAALSALDELDRAAPELRDAASLAEMLSRSLTTAAEQYGEAESRIRWLAQFATDIGSLFVGLGINEWFSVLGPLAPVGKLMTIKWLEDSLANGATKPVGPDDLDVPTWWNVVLSDPNTVALLRSSIGSSDLLLMGALGVPGGLAGILSAVGITGVGTTATAVAAAGSLSGLFVETPVKVTATSRTEQAPTQTNYEERLANVPNARNTESGEQIRIDTIHETGRPDRFEVYIGGTADFNPRSAGEPFDLTSNVATVAELPAGSYNAVVAAMKDAGITSSSEVMFTGYSQGATVASMLASSGDYNVKGIVSFAGAGGGIELPAGVPALIIEHEDDLVPALGGPQLNTEALTVRRQVFDSAADLPAGIAIPAHHVEYYAETAALLDDARSPQAVDMRRHLESFNDGAESVTSTLYRAERLPAGTTASRGPG